MRLVATLVLTAAVSVPGAELVFQSGFEPDTHIVPLNSKEGLDADVTIKGIDKSVPAPNDWVADWNGKFKFHYTGAKHAIQHAAIVKEPGTENSVLHFWIKGKEGRTTKYRVQANIYDNTMCGSELTYRVRLFIHPDFNKLKTFPGRIGWMTIAEFWNNPGWGPWKYPFRTGLGVHKIKEGPVENFYFGSHGQKLGVDEEGNRNVKHWGPGTLWSEHSTVPVPIGRWFELEVYLREGDEQHGRLVVSIREGDGPKQTVLDITNWMQHPKATEQDGWQINPMKIYTHYKHVDHIRNNGGALQCYWDDFRFWRGDAREVGTAATEPASATGARKGGS
ncbi:MAG: hypothetical protein JXR37_08130 [Kiritimatiellae bacterium]|nr:hypothetical protein [Kiritimatiellia bacterium]